MEVVALLIYVGALWVLAAVGFFVWNVVDDNHQHTDRLALLPIEDNWTDTTRSARAAEESKPS